MSGSTVDFAAVVRVDSAAEAQYLRHGGILPSVARSLAGTGRAGPPGPR